MKLQRWVVSKKDMRWWTRNNGHYLSLMKQDGHLRRKVILNRVPLDEVHWLVCYQTHIQRIWRSSMRMLQDILRNGFYDFVNGIRRYYLVLFRYIRMNLLLQIMLRGKCWGS